MANEIEYKPVKIACNGSRTTFPFDWILIDKNEVLVYLEALETGKQKLLSLGEDYSIILDDSNGGTVELSKVYDSSYGIVIARETSRYQGVRYSTSPGFQSSEIERSYDKISTALQEQDYTLQRCLKVDIGSINLDLTLPAPEKNKTLKWNDEGTGLVNTDISIDEIVDYLDESKKSAETAIDKANEAKQLVSEAISTGTEVKNFYSESIKTMSKYKSDVDYMVKNKVGSNFLAEVVKSSIKLVDDNLQLANGYEVKADTGYDDFISHIKRKKNSSDLTTQYVCMYDSRFATQSTGRRLYTPIKNYYNVHCDIGDTIGADYTCVSVTDLDCVIKDFENNPTPIAVNIKPYLVFENIADETFGETPIEKILVPINFDKLEHHLPNNIEDYSFFTYTENAYGCVVLGDEWTNIEDVTISEFVDDLGCSKIVITKTGDDTTIQAVYKSKPLKVVHVLNTETSFSRYNLDTWISKNDNYVTNEDYLTTREWVELQSSDIDYHKYYTGVDPEDNNDFTNAFSNKYKKLTSTNIFTSAESDVDIDADGNLVALVSNKNVSTGRSSSDLDTLSATNDKRFNLQFDFATPDVFTAGFFYWAYRSLYFYVDAVGTIFLYMAAYNSSGEKWRHSKINTGLKLDINTPYHIEFGFESETTTSKPFKIIVTNKLTNEELTYEFVSHYFPYNYYNNVGIRTIFGSTFAKDFIVDLTSMVIERTLVDDTTVTWSPYNFENKVIDRDVQSAFLPRLAKTNDEYSYIIIANGVANDVSIVDYKKEFQDKLDEYLIKFDSGLNGILQKHLTQIDSDMSKQLEVYKSQVNTDMQKKLSDYAVEMNDDFRNSLQECIDEINKSIDERLGELENGTY